MRVLLLVMAALGAGCATTPSDRDDPRARAAFETIEQTMLDATVLRADYAITSEGAFSAQLDGDLVAQKPGRAALSADGMFAGTDVALRLAADGERLRGSSGTQGFDEPAPPALLEGLVVGLLRMGVLHNLAMLSGGAPPDRTDGTVRDWVVPHSFAFAPGDAGEGAAISFALEVAGAPAGEVVLHYDPATNLPLRREQVVRFETGDMRVTERYEIETGGMIGPCRFDVAAIAVH